MDALIVVGGGIGAALVGWLVGRGGRSRDREATRRVLAECQEQLAGRERELAGLRVRREAQLGDLLAQVNRLESERRILQSQVASLKIERADAEARLDQEREAARDRLTRLSEATHQLESAFKVLAAEALHLNQQSHALDGLITPLQNSLEKYDEQVRWMEQARSELYRTLQAHLEAVTGAQQRLHLDTGTFVEALMHDRLSKLAEYFEDLRGSLERSTLTAR